MRFFVKVLNYLFEIPHLNNQISSPHLVFRPISHTILEFRIFSVPQPIIIFQKKEEDSFLKSLFISHKKDVKCCDVRNARKFEIYELLKCNFNCFVF